MEKMRTQAAKIIAEANKRGLSWIQGWMTNTMNVEQTNKFLSVNRCHFHRCKDNSFIIITVRNGRVVAIEHNQEVAA
jgi:hypothetical protein